MPYIKVTVNFITILFGNVDLTRLHFSYLLFLSGKAQQNLFISSLALKNFLA